jgi:gamma-glutamyltranspeptidase/glutathione hydrolase
MSKPTRLSRRSLGKLALGAGMGAAGAAFVGEAAAQPVSTEGLNPEKAEQLSSQPHQDRLGSKDTLRPELVGTFGMVTAGRHYAVEAGIRTLMAGGNAFDAGAASVFAASVTEISHFGFGGESPTIVYEAKTKAVKVVSGQGTAPAAATPAYFAKAGVIPGNGPNGGCIPAVLDAMCIVLSQFGTKTLAEVMAPAIELADGFPMYSFLRESFISQRAATEKYPASKATYYPNGHICEPGEIFRQPNLARTLRAIVAAEAAARKAGKNRLDAIEAGRNVFYKGDVARRIAAAIQADGGLMTYEDLANYRGRVEAPLKTSFYGYEVYKTDFWNQGPALLLSLNILEAADIRSKPRLSVDHLHTLAETIKLAFDDRNKWFGDPRFAKIPGEGLLSKAYAADRAKLIGATASMAHRYGDPWAFQAEKRPAGPDFTPHKLAKPGDPASDTTSIQIVDKDGNLFSCTPSSGWLQGGAYVAGDTGVPLGNRLTIFDLDPGSPNVIAGGKRPRTTLTPSIVLKDGKPFLAIGTPGGDNQDQQIANVLVNLLAYDMPLQQAIEAPRINSLHFHGSFARKEDEPGVLEIEDRVPADVQARLTALGHKLRPVGDYGVSTGIVAAGINPKFGTLRASADVRRERYAMGW